MADALEVKQYRWHHIRIFADLREIPANVLAEKHAIENVAMAVFPPNYNVGLSAKQMVGRRGENKNDFENFLKDLYGNHTSSPNNRLADLSEEFDEVCAYCIARNQADAHCFLGRVREDVAEAERFSDWIQRNPEKAGGTNLEVRPLRRDPTQQEVVAHTTFETLRLYLEERGL